MKAPYLKSKAIIYFFAFFVELGVFAHPGGLDKYGGHIDRKTGTYHYHRGTNAPAGRLPLLTEAPAPVPFEGQAHAKETETDYLSTVPQEGRTGAWAALNRLPWWVYLAGLACGYTAWEFASRYYQKRKGIQ